MTREELLKQAWPNGITTYELHTVEEGINLARTCRQYWFRGHSEKYPWLLPAMHRESCSPARENIEFWAGQRFRLRAPSFTSRVPDWKDYLSWLFLMQHNGVPTRLLDWTENILVALYFAVADLNDESGEVWCMNPHRLNYQGSSRRHICTPDDPPVQYLAAEVFLDKTRLQRFADEIGLKKKPSSPLALVPPFDLPRMLAQRSRFTIHPSPETNPLIEFLLRSDTCLVRYIVAAKNKAAIRRDLVSIGISHDTLFHSLESLAKTIKEEIREKDFEMERPPRFRSDSDNG